MIQKYEYYTDLNWFFFCFTQNKNSCLETIMFNERTIRLLWSSVKSKHDLSYYAKRTDILSLFTNISWMRFRLGLRTLSAVSTKSDSRGVSCLVSISEPVVEGGNGKVRVSWSSRSIKSRVTVAFFAAPPLTDDIKISLEAANSTHTPQPTVDIRSHSSSVAEIRYLLYILHDYICLFMFSGT